MSDYNTPLVRVMRNLGMSGSSANALASTQSFGGGHGGMSGSAANVMKNILFFLSIPISMSVLCITIRLALVHQLSIKEGWVVV